MNTQTIIIHYYKELFTVHMYLTLACQTLAVSQLDSVIIAPPGPVDGESQTLAHLQPAWEQLEGLVRSQQIAAIGTSDLDKDLLEQLYNWAQVSEQCDPPGGCTCQPLLSIFQTA